MMREKRAGSTGTWPAVRFLARFLAQFTARTALLCGLVGCTPLARDADTLVIASGTDLESANPVVTMHPMARQVQRHLLFVPLVQLDTLLAAVPALARDWQWDDARTTLTLQLRTDVFWHDGVPTTARDVVFTLQAVGNPAVGSPRLGDVRALRDVAAPDDSTVVVRFHTPQTAMPIVFAELPPVPQHVLAGVAPSQWRAHAFSTSPVGNGPYRFVSRSPGQRWRFERNMRHPAALGGPPRTRVVVVVVVDEASTKLAGLVSGELDVAGVAPSMAALVERDPLLTLETPPVLFTTMLVFNTTRPPFNDVRVRRAVSLAVNRPRIVEAAVAGYGTPTRRLVPPGVLPATDTGGAVPDGTVPRPHVDTATANALLREAGWQRDPNGRRVRNGERLTLTLLTVGSGELAVEQLLQADLAQIGVTVSIRTVELATFLTTLRAPQRDFDLAFTGVPGDIGLGHVRALLHSSQQGGALDYTGYHTLPLDHLLDRAFGAASATARADAWSAVDAHLDTVVPVAPLYHARGVQGRSAALTGVRMDLRGELATITQWSRQP